MRKKVIGILGFRGLVGCGALEMLKSTGKYQLQLGSRSIQTDQKQIEESEHISSQKVDLFDRQQLEIFCKPCDLVINCAGPSSKILSRVAQVCIDNNKLYVDPSGDKMMVKSISDYFKSKPAPPDCVLSAGVYPGLTEIFVNYLAEECYDEMFTVKEYFAGGGSFSKNGAYDIISSLANDEGAGLAFCKNGQIEKMTAGFGGSSLLPAPFGQVQHIPLVSDEFLLVARKQELKEAYFYNTFPNGDMLTQFIMIKASGQYKTEEQKIASAGKLIDIYKKGNNQENCFMLHTISSGQKGGKETECHTTLTCDTNWNELSGTIAGIVADELLEKGEHRGVCCYAQEMISAKSVITYLVDEKKAGLHQQER